MSAFAELSARNSPPHDTPASLVGTYVSPLGDTSRAAC
jgi:hypothetical protein